MSYLIFVQNHFNFDKRAFHIHLCYNADSILIILFKFYGLLSWTIIYLIIELLLFKERYFQSYIRQFKYLLGLTRKA